MKAISWTFIRVSSNQYCEKQAGWVVGKAGYAVSYGLNVDDVEMFLSAL